MGLFSSNFGRDFKVLFAGNAIARFIPFLTLIPLQKWFFTPEEFGVLALFVALTGPFINMASLRYEYAIVLVNRYKDQVNLLVLSLGLVGVVTILHLLLVLIFEDQFVAYQEDDRIRQFILWTPLGTLFMGVFNVFTYWLNRNKSYGELSQAKVLRTGGAEAVKLATGWQAIPAGLIIGTLVGQGAAALSMAFRFYQKEVHLLRLVSFQHMRKLAGRYKKFPMFTMPTGFVTASVATVYLSLFTRNFGAENVGFIGTSVTYFAGLMGIVSMTFSQIFYRNIVDIDDITALRKEYTKYLGLLLLATASVVIAIHLVPASLVVKVLGSSWEGLMPVLRLMAIWMGIAFVYSSLSFIYIKLEKQRLVLLLSSINLLLVYLVLSWRTGLGDDFYTTLKWFTMTQSAYYSFAIASVYVVLKLQPSKSEGSE